MDSLLRDPAQLSQLESLVTQQRYDESLKLLNDAIAKNPRDRDACLCRLLVVRIVVLRRQLAEIPQLPLSKILSLGSALVRPVGARWRALCHAGPWWRPYQPMLRMGDAGNFVLSQAKRLGAVGGALRFRPFMNVVERFGQFGGGEQESQPPLRRRHQRATAFAALSLLTAGVVSVALLSSGDTSHRQAPERQARVAVPVSLVQAPPVAPAPARDAKQETPVKLPAAAPSTFDSLPEPAGQEGTPARDPQEQAPAKTTSAEKPKQERNQLAKEKKGLANAARRNGEPAAKKGQAATARGTAAVARAQKAPAGDEVAKASAHFYRARRAIEIRQAARYAAPTVEKLSEGAVVAVLDVKNSWARVTLNGKAPGFVRVEHLGPVEIP